MATTRHVLLALAISSLLSTLSAYTLNPEKEVLKSLTKRDLGPFCQPATGPLTYDDCMATWAHLPDLRGEVRFSAEDAGIFGAMRVKLPYFERPRNVPTKPQNRCGIIIFNWPRLTGVTTVADWQWLKLAARQVINTCTLHAATGGFVFGLGAGRTYYGDKKDHPSGNLNIAVIGLPEDLPDDPNKERDWGSFLAGCARQMATDPSSISDLTQCPGYDGMMGNNNGRGPGPSGGSQSGSMTAWSSGFREQKPGACGKQSYCINGEGCAGSGLGCTCQYLKQRAADIVLGVAQDIMGTCVALTGST